LKINTKFFSIIFLICIFKNLHSYEIIRDPIFEDYFVDISNDLNLSNVDVYLIKSKLSNAFVIDDKIYFTTGLLELINEEDTLKAIYLHEYGHIVRNHFQSKKIKIYQSNNRNAFYSLFSIGLAVIVGNANVGVGSSITLNSSLVNDLNKYSVNFEIEADNFMIDNIKKNKLHTLELITFLSELPETSKNYFRTHPRNKDRINNLRQLDYKKSENSIKFDWIKSKYFKNSNNNSFNNFFKKLDKGIFDRKESLKNINKELIHYEAFKKGIFIDEWEKDFQNLLNINNNSFLKIEYINYLLENNLSDKYYIIDKLKFDKKLSNEYFYYYIYGKYYNKVKNNKLSNFYFCQYYKAINSKNKADFFCEKYDIKDIPTLDKSYALFK
jgi:predicted Zn-dependent protease